MSSNRTSESPQVARHLARQLQLLIRPQARPLEPKPERHVRRVRRPHRVTRVHRTRERERWVLELILVGGDVVAAEDPSGPARGAEHLRVGQGVLGGPVPVCVPARSAAGRTFKQLT